jgi:hypothetical protein
MIMRLWRVIGRTTYRCRMSRPAVRPMSRSIAEAPGSWLAVDRATNEIRAAATNPYVLAAKIKQEGITGVAIVRAPDPSEPELVGLG